MVSNENVTYKTKQLLLLSFGLPFFILSIIYIAMGVYPFGKETLLTIDLAQQYVDFFSYYRHSLLHEPSALFYSFSKGIGGEMVGLWSYYLNSPFNILILFFPQKLLPLGVSFLILLKIALSGLSFGILLIKKFAGKNLLVPLFALSYALMGYTIVNQLHLMWLDSLIFLPLIVLGLEEIMDGKKGTLYSAMLAIALFSQYYLTYMICLFLILYFIFSLAKQKTTRYYAVKDKLLFAWNRLWKFSVHSLLGAGLAAFSLVPNFVSLLGGKASHTSQTLEWHSKYPLPEILSKLYLGAFDFDQLPSGLPNIFIGTVALVSFLYYFFNKSFNWKERLTALLISIFFVISMNIDFLNKVWHAFQNPAWYPYRFSFVVCFFFILNGFRSMNQRKSVPLGFAIILLVLQTVSALYVLEKDFSFLEPIQILVSALLLIVVLVLLLLQEADFKAVPYLLLIVTVLEMSANSTIDLVRLGYVDMAPFNDYQALLNEMVDDIRPKDNEFYRIEKTFQRSKNDSFQANYPSASHFSSTFEAEVPTLFGRLGFPESSFVISYSTGTLFTDAFFGIRYYAENREMPEAITNDETLYNIRPNAYRPDLNYYQPYTSEFRTDTYLNEHAFSLGFTVSDRMAEVELLDDQPIANQEKIMQAMSEKVYTAPFYTIENIDSIITQNITSNNNAALNKTYLKADTGKPAFIEFQFTPKSADPYYLTMDSRINEDNTKFTLNTESFPYYKSYRTDQVFNLASDQMGETVQFSVELLDEMLTFRDLNLYRLNYSQFNDLLMLMQNQQLTIDSFSQTNITGHIDVQNDNEILMFTIPYSKGWQLEIDGEQVDSFPVLDSLLAASIPTGTHTIKLTYRTPYLLTGIGISVACGLLLLWIEAKQKLPFNARIKNRKRLG